MPICSYLVYPHEGQEEQLQQELQAIAECHVVPAENHSVLILVTDTANEEQEKALQKKLQQMSGIQCLALSFGQCEVSNG